MRKRYALRIPSLISILLVFFFSHNCLAAVITADNLDYNSSEGIYILSGSVKIEKENISIRADKVIYNENSFDADAEGNIIFQDKDVTITSKKAEINIDSKTGRIYEAVIFFKKDNYWITGNNISKTGDKSYYISEAAFTTCNSEPYLIPDRYPKDYFEQKLGIETEMPDWCFKGQDVQIEIGKALTAKNVTYSIKGLPVLYSPYMLTPVLTDRQTGFLMPIVGTSSKKGFQFSPAYYWAIDDDKDATFYLDYMSRRGFGKGIEFRYIDSTGIGRWQAYHLRDKKLDKDFFALQAEDRFQFDKITGFASINYINDADFYKEYGYNTDGRITNLRGLADINRFFQSSVEFFLPFKNSRLYFLSQYWVDMQDKDAHTLQRLPELGYVIHPTRIGPLLFTMASSISNFYREKDTKGQRFFINPSISHSFGDTVQFFQSLSLIQTAYNLTSSPEHESFTNKETFEYRANAQTRFYKYYNAFVHDIELSLGYRFIPGINQMPVFDSVELLNKKSQLELSIYNSIRAKDLTLSVRLVQPYDLNPKPDSKSLLPVTMDVIINSQPLILRLEAAYDFNKDSIDKINSLIYLRVSDKTNIYAAERYDKTNDIRFFSIGFEKTLSQRFSLGANLSYDAKGGGLRDSTIRTLYKQQCWALNAAFSRKPGDQSRSPEYNISLIFELTGIGKLRTL